MLLQQTPIEYRARGESALYDAIKAGIQMTVEAPGEEEAIRSVGVLKDGKYTTGDISLHDFIVMRVGSGEVGDDDAGAELLDQCTGTPVGDGQVWHTSASSPAKAFFIAQVGYDINEIMDDPVIHRGEGIVVEGEVTRVE